MRSYVNDYTGQQEISTTAVFQDWVVDQNTGEIRVFENSNETEYQLANVSVNLKDGKSKETTALVYAGNYNHPDADFKEGRSYLCTITKGDDGQAYVRLSHLENRPRLTAEEIGFDEMFDSIERTETEEVVDTRTVEEQMA